jgi:hypothetical protein
LILRLYAATFVHGVGPDLIYPRHISLFPT